MRKLLISGLFMAFCISRPLMAQSDKKYVRQGNRDYEKNKYADSEILYRKASDKNQNYPDAVFNTGDALYRQKKYEDAGKEFIRNSGMNENKTKKSEAMFNLGNSFLQSQKYQESIDAFKNSLKLDPSNPQAKYNLAYAQDMLKQQQQQKQQQNKNNKDQNKQDQKNENQKQNKDNKNQQSQDQTQNQNEKQQQQQQQQQGMSKEDAERLLNALANEEKKVQEKVKLAKAEKEKVRTVKNW